MYITSTNDLNNTRALPVGIYLSLISLRISLCDLLVPGTRQAPRGIPRFQVIPTPKENQEHDKCGNGIHAERDEALPFIVHYTCAGVWECRIWNRYLCRNRKVRVSLSNEHDWKRTIYSIIYYHRGVKQSWVGGGNENCLYLKSEHYGWVF
jgi:hypothetical protein